MRGLFIIAHAPLASSLKTVAQHAFPDCASGVVALDVFAQMPVEEVEAQARQMLDGLGASEALILTDAFGATPGNVAERLADGVTVRVVAGVNVPMLWRSLCYPDGTLESAAERAVSGGKHGVMQVSVTKPQNQTLKTRGHGEDDGQDQ